MKKEKIIRLIVSILLAFAITSFLVSLDKPTTLQKSIISNVTYDEIIDLPITVSPSYFSSVGEVYISLNSKNIKDLFMEFSSDKVQWEKVYVTDEEFNIKNLNDFTKIGFINLNDVRNNIYQKIQSGQIVQNDTPFKEITIGLNGVVKPMSPLKNRRDLVVLFIVFITSLGTIYTLLDSFEIIFKNKIKTWPWGYWKYFH